MRRAASIACALLLATPGFSADSRPQAVTIRQTKQFKADELRIRGGGDWFLDNCSGYAELLPTSKSAEGKHGYHWEWKDDLTRGEYLPDTDPLTCTAIGYEEWRDDGGAPVFFLQEFTVPRRGSFHATGEVTTAAKLPQLRVAFLAGVPLDATLAILRGKFPPQVPARVPWGLQHICLSGEVGVTDKQLQQLANGRWRYAAKVPLDAERLRWVDPAAPPEDVHVVFFDAAGWAINSVTFKRRWSVGPNAIEGEAAVPGKPATFHIIGSYSWAGG
jgi:hypothetical protein